MKKDRERKNTNERNKEWKTKGRKDERKKEGNENRE